MFNSGTIIFGHISLFCCLICLLFSKAACGLSHKPKVQIVDIDAVDVNNELAVVEYVEDIYNFYKIAEVYFRVF